MLSAVGFTPQAMSSVLVELTNTLFKNPSIDGVLGTLLNIPKEKRAESGILEEFMKHASIAKEYAAEVSDVIYSESPSEFEILETRLQEYFDNCGELESNLNTLQNWVEMSSIVGMIHGNTLSINRVGLDVNIFRWRNIKQQVWSYADVLLMSTVGETMIGVEGGAHVMTSEIPMLQQGTLKNVLDKYDDMTTKLKEEYCNDLIQSDDFVDYGFILSDYCPDLFDGKQLTI